MVKSGKFQMYDFGSDARNIAHYGQVRGPPNTSNSSHFLL